MTTETVSVLTDEQKLQIRRAANEFASRLMEAGADFDVEVVRTPLHEVGKREPKFLYHIEIQAVHSETI